MAVPTPPYCTMTELALRLPKTLSPHTYFNEYSTPSYDVAYAARRDAMARLQSSFARFGFIIPLEKHPDEDWTDWQTDELRRLTINGAASMLLDALHPVPTLPGSNIHPPSRTEKWNQQLEQVVQDGLGFRANYRSGSRAVKYMLEPRPPDTDVLAGKYVEYDDPLEPLTEFTRRVDDDRVAPYQGETYIIKDQ